MPRKLEEIIAGVRTAADAFKPTGINIPTDELIALCDAAEKYQQTIAAFNRASQYHREIERNPRQDRMNETYVVPASATHGPR